MRGGKGGKGEDKKLGKSIRECPGPFHLSPFPLFPFSRVSSFQDHLHEADHRDEGVLRQGHTYASLQL